MYSLGDFGAAFHPSARKHSELVVFVARPGLRVWKSTPEGTVIETLLLKEALRSPHSVIPLLGLVPSTTISTEQEQFTRILFYDEKYLVTHGQGTLFVIDPEKNLLFGTCRDLKSIISIATNKDEIFVLLPNRNLIRISGRADTHIAGKENVFFERQTVVFL